MNFENQIRCLGKDDVKTTFSYSIEESEINGFKKWIFRIVPQNLEFTDWFEFSVVELGNGVGKVITMNTNFKKEYSAKGIPDKMIEEASNKLELNIISSTNKKAHKFLDNEWRTEAASKVWNRLVTRGIAIYDEEKDLYTYRNED